MQVMLSRPLRRVREQIAESVTAGRLIGSLPKLMAGRGDHRALVRQVRTIRANVECPHNESHILSFIVELLGLAVDVPGVIVEAGCDKGREHRQDQPCRRVNRA